MTDSLTQLVATIAEACVSRKATDVRGYQLRHPLFEAAVMVATVSNSTHLKSLRDEVAKVCDGVDASGGLSVVSGQLSSGWVMVTMPGTLVLHIMLPSMRSFYQLDELYATQGPVTHYTEDNATPYPQG